MGERNPPPNTLPYRTVPASWQWRMRSAIGVQIVVVFYRRGTHGLLPDLPHPSAQAGLRPRPRRTDSMPRPSPQFHPLSRPSDSFLMPWRHYPSTPRPGSFLRFTTARSRAQNSSGCLRASIPLRTLSQTSQGVTGDRTLSALYRLTGRCS